MLCRPPRPPQPAAIIHTTPVLEDTADIAYTRQRATLTLANMTIAVHITDTSAPDELVYVFADHLGSATLLADESGDPLPNSAVRYFPFGDWRTEPTADETSRWYTGHMHDNLSHNDLGLIYMNARFYLPGVGRFVSADILVPNLANPQSYNRYSYVENQLPNLVDPSGHCGGNPDNNNPFDADGNLYYDCTLDNFQTMPIALRLQWIQAFMAQSEGGLAEQWFNNIQGIIEGFIEFNLSAAGTWVSYVDAGILHSIQDGYALFQESGGFERSASLAWKSFFEGLYNGAADAELVSRWGEAEALGTAYGIAYASDHGLFPNAYESFFLSTGDVYRTAAADGGLGNAFGGWTFTSWIHEVNRIVPNSLTTFMAQADMLEAIIAYQIGQWFNDPRSTVDGHSPVYWYSTQIWRVQSWFD